jgi:hypothetical protein
MPATKNSAIDAVRARWRAGSDSTRCASGGAANGDDDSGEEDSDTGRLVRKMRGRTRRPSDLSDSIEPLTILPGDGRSADALESGSSRGGAPVTDWPFGRCAARGVRG